MKLIKPVLKFYGSPWFLASFSICGLKWSHLGSRGRQPSISNKCCPQQRFEQRESCPLRPEQCCFHSSSIGRSGKPSPLSNARTKAERSPPRSNASHRPAHAAPRPITRTSRDDTTHGGARSRTARLRPALPRRAEATPTSAALLCAKLSNHRLRPVWHDLTGKVPTKPPAPHLRHAQGTPLFYKTGALRFAARPEHIP